jgi:hypothetical protein
MSSSSSILLSENNFKLNVDDLTTELYINKDFENDITLLIDTHSPHPKFTAALQYIFNLHSLDLLKLNPPSTDGICSIKNATNKENYNEENEYSTSNPEPPITLDQLHMFLDAFDTLSHPPENLDFLFELYSNNPSLSYRSKWDTIVCCSWSAFHSMYIDLACRCPRTVWNHLFAFGFDGFLDLNVDFTQAERATAARGLCLSCNKPATTHLTRTSLLCQNCEQEFEPDTEDLVFICC